MDGTYINNDNRSDATKHTTFGTFANQMDCALDLQKSFVAYSQSFLLYFWHKLDNHNLMKLSMQRLDDSVSKNNGAAGILRIINMQSQNEEHFATKNVKLAPARTELEHPSQSIKQHGRSMERSELHGLIEALYKERRDLMVRLATASNSAVCNIVMDQLAEIFYLIEKNERNLED